MLIRKTPVTGLIFYGGRIGYYGYFLWEGGSMKKTIVCVLLTFVIVASSLPCISDSTLLPDSFNSASPAESISVSASVLDEKPTSSQIAPLVISAAPRTFISRKGSEEKNVETPATLAKMATIDYYADSVSELSDTQLSVNEIKKLISKYGKFDGNPGMPVEEYRAAMEYHWIDYTVYNKEPSAVSIDIAAAHTYDDYVKIMRQLSRYEGVYLYEIGFTYEGRRMYALEVDVPSDREKNTVLLTGLVHSRETAGTAYILKEIADLLSAGTEEAAEVLASTRFACVPCVNPDGFEAIAFNPSKYTYSNGVLWKAATNGTDLNRNFPGLAWGQILNGNKKSKYISTSSNKQFYPGEYAGCNPETKALIKFLYHYIVIEQAHILIDYHQQGAITYAGKPWSTSASQKACKELSDVVLKPMNKKGRNYIWFKENEDYDLNGTGSTLTDYAVSIALGAKFSPAYGFCVYTDGKKEYPLAAIPKADKAPFKLEQTNPSFRTMTFEIGYGQQYLGYSESTRQLIAKEYETKNFGSVLYTLSDYAKKIK